MSRAYIELTLKPKPWTVAVPDWTGPYAYLDERELVEVTQRAGSHFFDRDTMRAFKSRLHDIKAGGDGWYFITSEKHEWHGGYDHAPINEPRQYTVRKLTVIPDRSDIRIDEVSTFQEFPTLGRARTAMKRAIEASRLAVAS